jgi:surface polysaccharide O-acyltransferase-like enzyme
MINNQGLLAFKWQKRSSAMKGKKPRIAEIQVLRGFSFLAVVLQHTIGHYAYLPEAQVGDGILLGILLVAAKFAVPVFIFITGLVLFYNYRDGVHTVDFIRKRCKDVVLPYALWSIVYIIAFHDEGFPLWSEIYKLPAHLFAGTAMYHLWYVIMIIQFYLLYPLIQKTVSWIRLVFTRRQITIGLTAIALGFMILTGLQHTIANVATAWDVPLLTPFFSEYSDRNAIYFFLYFVMGIIAGLNLPSWKLFVMKWKKIWIGLYILAAGWLLYRIISHFYSNGAFKIHYNDTLLVQPFMVIFLIISIIVMYIGAVAFQEQASKTLLNGLNYIGHYSYGAYLAHALMLVVAVFVTDYGLPGWNLVIRTMVAFIVCTALSVSLAWLLSYLRLSRFMTGTPLLKKN